MMKLDKGCKKMKAKKPSSTFGDPATKYSDASFLFNNIKSITKTIETPEIYAVPSEDLANNILSFVTSCYNYSKANEPVKTDSLNKLITENMEIDQIWGQLELLNKPLYKYATKSIKNNFETSAGEKNGKKTSKVSKDEEESENEEQQQDGIEENSDNSDIGEEEDQENLDEEDDEENIEDDSSAQEDDDDDDDNQNLDDEKLENDPFFNLDEMEAFIKDGERRAELGSEEEDDELLEYLNQSGSEIEDGEDDAGIDWEKMKEGKAALEKKDIRYEDFYDDPKDLSKYEQKKRKMQEKIEELEKHNIEEKPWQLKGEVSGKQRPTDSLLEEYVIFEHATKTAPIITIEQTMELEDIIKKRIKDCSWDDVIRKSEIKETQKKELPELVHEKSKHGLADVYERQLLRVDDQEKEQKLKEKYEEINKIFSSLSHKLDALCNFHYAPKPIEHVKETKKNAASITMEEVLPTSVSDATLLAPEEVYTPLRKPRKGQSELTSTDKKSLRRAAKAKAKKGDGNKKDAEESKGDHAATDKSHKDKNEKKDKKSKKAKLPKGVERVENTDTTKYTQSTAFFNKLQESAQSDISKVKGDKSDKSKKQVNATSFKL